MSHSLPDSAPRHRQHVEIRRVGFFRQTTIFAGCVIGLLLATASVQTSMAQPAAARQVVNGAGADTSPDALLAAAGRVLTLLDAGDIAPLWQEMPAELQARFKRDTFLTDMQAARQSIGVLRQRTWAGIGRLRYAAPSTPQGIPAGLYANVEMSSTTADGRPLIERVSFRIESNGSFRFTGYVPRQLGTTGTAPASLPATAP